MLGLKMPRLYGREGSSTHLCTCVVNMHTTTPSNADSRRQLPTCCVPTELVASGVATNKTKGRSCEGKNRVVDGELPSRHYDLTWNTTCMRSLSGRKKIGET
jgi:hypothetical protein